MPILFDLDGVLVDNTAFERAVASLITERLATVKGLDFGSATRLWLDTLESHRSHPRWHDYGLHCAVLDLGDYWKQAHIQSRDLLRRFEGVDVALQLAQRAHECWIVSDALDWVVEFKLRAVDLLEPFVEIFTVDRCGSNKRTANYWKVVEALIETKQGSTVFIDNRMDCIEAACDALARCTAVWVDGPDYAAEIGFGMAEGESYNQSVIHSTHADLAKTLSGLLDATTGSRRP